LNVLSDAVSCQLWGGLARLINDNNVALGCGGLAEVDLSKNQAVAVLQEFAPIGSLEGVILSRVASPAVYLII
jgi:hypothetical protein